MVDHVVYQIIEDIACKEANIEYEVICQIIEIDDSIKGLIE